MTSSRHYAALWTLGCLAGIGTPDLPLEPDEGRMDRNLLLTATDIGVMRCTRLRTLLAESVNKRCLHAHHISCLAPSGPYNLCMMPALS